MAIDRQIEESILRLGGYNKFYEEIIDRAGFRLGPPNARGERRCNSPFPFSNDSNPSFSMNELTGLWRDWHAEPIIGMGGGNFMQFLALMTARIDNNGKPRPEWTKTEREFKIKVGISNPVNKEWLTKCQELVVDEDCTAMWRGRKPWNQETLVKLGIGWDPQKNRIVIPMYDRDDKIANTRLYKPKREDDTIPKMMWSQNGLQDNYLFPHCAWQEPWVMLVEGEPDAITLRSFDYNAVSGTEGSGGQVPGGMWWVGKKVYVWGDDDDVGKKAIEEWTSILVQGALAVMVMQTPQWPGKRSQDDPSDYINHMLAQGMGRGDIQREITKLMKEAKPVASAADVYDAVPKPVPFRQALTSHNANTKVQIDATFVASGSTVYSMPTVMQVVCPGQGQMWCKTCPMHTQYRGVAKFSMDPRSPLLLKMVQVSDDDQFRVIRDLHRIAPKCSEPRMTIHQSIDVKVAVLTSTIDEDAHVSGDVEKQRHEAFILMRKGKTYDPNTDYCMTGFIYPMPRTQKLTFVIDAAERLASKIDEFSPLEHHAELLEFRNHLEPFDHIIDIADDLAASVTEIKMRADMHLAYLVGFHSVISFNAFGSVVERGWTEGLILGDTRCGKSKTFNRLARWYGSGILVDCKMLTPAGVIGAVETSTITGERFVIPGIMPQSDKRGPIAFDEFSASKESRSSMMDHLSSTRAEGIARVTKAAFAAFHARCRLFWLSNPGKGKLMRDIGGYGVECIADLINQPEDIARFDYAMTVTQDEVSSDILNPSVPGPPAKPRRSQEAAQALMVWAWSRRPDQVQWAENAEATVTAVARTMCEKYDASIPLVESADQRNRVAKIAVAVAVMCFSASEDLSTIIVRREHVIAVARLFATWYDKPSMAYNKYSNRVREQSILHNEEDVTKALNALFEGNEVVCAEQFIRLSEFTEAMLGIMSPAGNVILIHDCMRVLSNSRAIEASNKKDVYKLTRQFVRFLTRYIADKKSSHPARDAEESYGTDTDEAIPTT